MIKLAAHGYYRDPSTKQCWETCQACYRCAAKGTRLECNRCSGRFDPHGRVDPHPDDKCFVPGTLISMADGSFRPIEEIRSGDVVLNRLGEPDLVGRILTREHKGKNVRLFASGNNDPLEMTHDHPVWLSKDGVDWSYTAAADIEEGDYVQGVYADAIDTVAFNSRGMPNRKRLEGNTWASKVFRVEEYDYNGPVHNFEVIGDHSYVANGWAVSNCRCTQGILQFTKESGEMVQVRYKTNPFKGSVLQKEKTTDEKEWDAYVENLQDRFGEGYDPIQVYANG